jgi:metallo-beta-lactamase class B
MHSSRSFARFVFTIALLLGVVWGVSAQRDTTHDNEEWYRPYKPFRIVGNVYYVGSYDICCYLITTPEGHILINEGMQNTEGRLKANVEELGFRFEDIKVLLTSQAHYDHVGALAAVQRMTGARVMIDEGDVSTVEDGGNSDYLYGGHGVGYLFAPVKVDRRLRDHDKISLGGMELEVLHHPGHTKGSCSYMMTVKDEHKSYKLLIANAPRILSEANIQTQETTIKNNFQIIAE